MIELEANEARVLGVLVEKAHTVPSQYPLTLNALVSGCNQKNNRHPVMSLSEDDALEALDSLRHKGLVREVMLSGSRVAKYKHDARDRLGVDTGELVVLVELLLRGPQTLGELRGRASRMHELESIDVVQAILRGLADREEPLVRQLPPAPGSRASLFVQLLAPGLHPTDTTAASRESSALSSGISPATPSDPADDRLAQLERSVAALAERVEHLEQQTRPDRGDFGAAD